MIKPDQALSIKRQPELLNIARGSAYYVPREASEADQSPTRRIDELLLAAVRIRCYSAVRTRFCS